MTALMSLIRPPACLAIPTCLCYTPGPEADGVSVRAPSQYRLHHMNSINRISHGSITLQYRFQISGSIGWGISDGCAAPACGNPVRSFPQVSRRRSSLVIELRLNQQSAAARLAQRRTSAEAGDVDERVGPRLSTAFAEQNGYPSPGPRILRPGQHAASRQGEMM